MEYDYDPLEITVPDLPEIVSYIHAQGITGTARALWLLMSKDRTPRYERT